jgi:hypothetical protein
MAQEHDSTVWQLCNSPYFSVHFDSTPIMRMEMKIFHACIEFFSVLAARMTQYLVEIVTGIAFA